MIFSFLPCLRVMYLDENEFSGYFESAIICLPTVGIVPITFGIRNNALPTELRDQVATSM